MAYDFSISGLIQMDNGDFKNKLGDLINKLNDFGIDLKSMGSKATSVFSNMGVDVAKLASKFGGKGGLITVIVATTIALQKLGAEMNKATSAIVKGTGATGEALREFEENAQDAMIEGVGRSAEEVGSMVADLNTRFAVTGRTLTNLTKQFAKFSNVTDTDTKTAINEVADVVNKWGLSVEDINPLLEQLTKAGQMSGISIGELTNGLKSGQVTFKQFGMSTTQSIAFLSNLSQKGVETSSALMGMRTALAYFSSQGINASKGFEEVSEKIRNAKSETEALQISFEVFGTRAGAEMVRVLRDNTNGIEEYTEALKNAGGTIEETNKASKSSQQAMEELKTSLAGTFQDFGKGIDTLWRTILEAGRNIVEMISPVIKPIGSVFKDVFDFISELLSVLFENIQEFRNQFGSVTESIGSILNTMAKFVHKVLGNVLNVFKETFGLIFAIINGKWELAWLYAQNILLRVVDVIFDACSTVVNTFAKMVNGIIEILNGLVYIINLLPQLFGTQLIGYVEKLSEATNISDTLGIQERIQKNTERIDELTGKSAERIAGEIGAVSNEVLNVTQQNSKLTTKTTKKTLEDIASKYKSTVDMLKLAYEEELSYAEYRKASSSEIFEIKKKYLMDELNMYIETAEAQRKEAMLEAKNDEDRAIINKKYDEEISAHRLATINQIIEEEKKYFDEERELAESNAETELQIYKQSTEQEIKLAEKKKTSAKKVYEMKRNYLLAEYDMTNSILHSNMENEIAQAKTAEQVQIIRNKYNVEFQKNSIELYNNLDDLNEEYAQNNKVTFAKVLSVVKKVANEIKNVFSKVFSVVGKVFSTISSGMNKLFNLNTDEALENLLVFEDKVLTFFVETLPQLPKFFESALSSIGILLENIFSAQFDIGSVIASISKSIAIYIPKIVKNLVKLVPSIIVGVVGSMAEWIGSGEFEDAINEIIDTIIEGFENFDVDSVSNVINKILSAFLNVVTNVLPKFLKSIVSFISDKLIPMLVKIIPNIISVLPKILSAIVSSLPSMISKLASALITNIPTLLVSIVNAISDNLPTLIEQLIEMIPRVVVALVEAIVDAFQKVNWLDVLKSIVKGAVNIVIGIVNGIIGAINLIPGINIPKLQYLAKGTNNAKSGLTIVGEQGPELVDMHGSERVYTAQNTRELFNNSSNGGNTFNVTFNDVRDTTAYSMMKQMKDWQRSLAFNAVI